MEIMKKKFLTVLYRVNIGVLLFAFAFGCYKISLHYLGHHVKLMPWLTFVSGLLGLFLVCFQIREQQNEHQANLKIYATLKKPLFYAENGLDIQGPYLHIMPVNIGLVPGTYRILGVCTELDWKKYLCPELKKIKKGKEANYGIFSQKIFYNSEDLFSKESTQLTQKPDKIVDMTGSELLFPKKEAIFETIQPKGLGNIKDFELADQSTDRNSIQKKLKLESYVPVKLMVVYLDPGFNPYTTKIRVTLTNDF